MRAERTTILSLFVIISGKSTGRKRSFGVYVMVFGFQISEVVFTGCDIYPDTGGRPLKQNSCVQRVSPLLYTAVFYKTVMN